VPTNLVDCNCQEKQPIFLAILHEADDFD